MKSKRLIALFVGVVCAMALGGAVALAQATDDAWFNSQGTESWSATGSTSFSGGGITVTCSNDTAGGANPGAAPDMGLVAMNQPTFAGCGDTNSVAVAGAWTIAFWSDGNPLNASGQPLCPTDASSNPTGNDENTTHKDCVQIHVPSGGATLTVGGMCTVIFGPADVWGYLTENSPRGSDTITFKPQTLSTGGTCGVTSGTFSGTYTLGPVSRMYLDDNSGTPDDDMDS